MTKPKKTKKTTKKQPAKKKTTKSKPKKKSSSKKKKAHKRVVVGKRRPYAKRKSSVIDVSPGIQIIEQNDVEVVDLPLLAEEDDVIEVEVEVEVKITPTKIPKTIKKPTSTKTTGNYLSKKELMKAVLESKAKGQMTNDLALKLQLLTARYAKHPWFAKYTYNQDMQAYAVLMLVRTWNSFNPEKSDNPFAFYTQCIKNSFQQYKNHEKRQRTIKDELLVEQGMTPSYTYQTEYETEYRHQLEEEREREERYAQETQQEMDETSLTE